MQFIPVNYYNGDFASAFAPSPSPAPRRGGSSPAQFFSYEDLVQDEYNRRRHLAQQHEQERQQRLYQARRQQELQRQQQLEERKRQALQEYWARELERERREEAARAHEERRQAAIQAEQQRRANILEQRRQAAILAERKRQALLRAEQERRQALYRAEQERRQALYMAEQQKVLEQQRAQGQQRAREQQRAQEQQRRVYWAKQYEEEQLASQAALNQLLGMLGLVPMDTESDNDEPENPSMEEDPEVSVPVDDDSEWDIYKEEVPKNTEPVEAPFLDLKQRLTGSPVQVRVRRSAAVPADSDAKVHKKSSTKQRSQSPSATATASETSTPSESDNDSSTEKTEAEVSAALAAIEQDVNSAVETYTRIFNAESSSSSSEDDDDSMTAASLTSRIKVLQKAQLQLENMYTRLDKLPHTSSNDARKLKRQLTTQSVSVADKVEDLIRVLDSHRTQLLAKSAEEASAANSDSESESSEPESTKATESSKPESSESTEANSSAPVKTTRKVTIEVVPDESEHEFE